jgi:hypothetical protein
MTRDSDCPLDVVEEARRLACRIEAQDLPLDFDPTGLSWKENLFRIARRYTNYDVLSRQLRDWLVQAWKDGDVPCEQCATDIDQGVDLESLECPHHWSAQQELSRAAQTVAERKYQTWLARKALDRRTRPNR